MSLGPNVCSRLIFKTRSDGFHKYEKARKKYNFISDRMSE